MDYSLKIDNRLSRVGSLVICITLACSGCEGDKIEDSSFTDAGTAPTDTVMTNAVVTNTASAVLNDDPNCELVVKCRDRTVSNDGQVHYVKRVLVSDPFGSANPVCVQYNDTQIGEVTVWKDQRSTGRRIDVLPTDRGIDKVVVWYE